MKRSRLARLIVAFACLFGAVAGAAAEARDADRTFDRALSDVRQAVAAQPGDRGIVIAVTDRHGLRLIATHGYADIKRHVPVTRDTLFAIGSISKSFTAITLMQLRDEGRFDPAAPIQRYIPEFRLKTRFPEVTGHALLSHTAGLPNYLASFASMRFAVSALKDFEPSYAPGEHFWYSNTGYQLLGYAAEAIAQAPFPAVLRRRVLAPLGMASSYPEIDEALRRRLAISYVVSPTDGAYVEAPWFDYMASDGGVVSNGADMASYVRMLLNGGKAPGGRLLSPDAFARLTAPVLDHYAYGLKSVTAGGEAVIGHTGSIAGFNAHIEAHPNEGFGIVFLSNARLDKAFVDRVVLLLSRARGGHDGASLFMEGPTTPYSVADGAVYAGRYGSADGVLTFTADAQGGLQLSEAGKALPLTKLGQDTYGLFASDGGPRSFHFVHPVGARTATEVSSGIRWFARDPATTRTASTVPGSYAALVGRYLNHGPEGPDVRVFVRHGELVVEDSGIASTARRLRPTGSGQFALADPAWAPERLAFDTVVDGKAQRLMLSGVALYRVDLP